MEARKQMAPRQETRPALAPVLGLVALLSLPGAAARAQDDAVSDNRVAADTAWSVFVEEDPKECWAVSAPRETVNTRDGDPVQVRRGEILLFATYRPGQDVPEISFTGGYPFDEDITVDMTVGEDEYQLFVDGEWAWAGSEAEDQRIAEALRGGAEAVLQARSSRGTDTRDTFSLFGFTAATEEAARQCAEE